MDQPQEIQLPENEDNNALECFICPITYDVMENPVISKSGHSFEKRAIEEWIKKGGANPLTREVMSIDELIENRNLKEAISVWKSLDTEWKSKAEQLKQLKIKLEKQEQELSVSNVNFMKKRFKIQQRKQESKHEETITGVPDRFKENELVEDAIFYTNHKNYKIPIKKFEKLLAELPNDAWILEKLGWLNLKYGNQLSDINLYYTAIVFYEKTIMVAPDNDEAYRFCGWLLSRIRLLTGNDSQIEKEITYYHKALGINPQNSNIHNNLGMHHFHRKDYAVAKKHLLECTRLNPEKWGAWITLSKVYLMEGNFLESKNILTSAISNNPEHELLLFALGDCYKIQGDKNLGKHFYESAIEYYKKSYMSNSNYLDAYTNCGYCLTRLGPNNYDKAMKLYKKVLEIDFEDENAKKNLTWLEERMMNKSSNQSHYRDNGRGRGKSTYNTYQNRGGNYSPNLYQNSPENIASYKKQGDSFRGNSKGRGL